MTGRAYRSGLTGIIWGCEHELVQGHYYQDYCFRRGVGGNGERRVARVGADIAELSRCGRIAVEYRIFPISQGRASADRWKGRDAGQAPGFVRLALFGRWRHVEDRQGRYHDQACQTTDDGVRADLKKGPKRFRFDPFTAVEIAPKTSDALASNAPPASVLTLRFGLLDCCIVIPGSANFAHAQRSKIGRRLCLALATCADARAASCRELVDPCGPLIQTRIHHHLSLRGCALTQWCARLVLHWLLKPISSVHSASAT